MTWFIILIVVTVLSPSPTGQVKNGHLVVLQPFVVNVPKLITVMGDRQIVSTSN
jgi:hypothetical protein